MWGSSASDVFVVGEFAFIFYFDGTRWTPVKRSTNAAPVDTVFAIHGIRNEVHFSLPGNSGDLLVRFAPW